MLIVCIIISNCLQDCSQLCTYVTRRCLNGTLRQTSEKCVTVTPKSIAMVDTYVKVAPSRAKFSSFPSQLKHLSSSSQWPKVTCIQLMSFNNNKLQPYQQQNIPSAISASTKAGVDLIYFSALLIRVQLKAFKPIIYQFIQSSPATHSSSLFLPFQQLETSLQLLYI